EPARPLAAAEIERHRRDGDIVLGANLAFGFLEIAGVARQQHEIAAFGGQEARRRPANALGAAGDERLPSGEIEIHSPPPPVVGRYYGAAIRPPPRAPQKRAAFRGAAQV